jgi:hypothetical protein
MSDVEPLKLKCTDSKCDADLHCFRPQRKRGDNASEKPTDRHVCRDCGADLVDWETVHRRDIAEVETLFEELPKELIRHHFWHTPLPEAVVSKAYRYKPEVIARRTRAAIRSHVSRPSSELWRDGAQTPMEAADDAQIYYMGMHATACCCRKCMEYWHGIPREMPLDEEAQKYFAHLVWLYVCQRLDEPTWLGVRP